MIDELARAIREKRAMLFVGSGVSVGLGAPTWSGLINKIAELLDYDPDVFSSLESNYLTSAEFYKIKKGTIGNLRSWMDNNWSVDDSVLSASVVHQLICDLDFPIIYTTNYDRHIEGVHRINGKKHTKIANIGDMKGSIEGTQIIKLHGDFDDDNSIVLTESDYFERLSFESPLDIKLRSDSLSKVILFVGYSLTDINVRLLLYKLWKLWSISNFADKRPKSFLFLTKPNAVQETVLDEWGVNTIVSEESDPGEALENFLIDLKARI